MQFNYTARTKEGHLQTGVVEAAGFDAAIDALQRHNLVIISLKFSPISFWSRRLRVFEKIKKEDVMMFSRQLSVLLEADMSLVESLRILTRQLENPYFKEILFQITSDVDGGMAFSKALSAHPKIFTSFYVNMIRTGETTGKLYEVSNYLADHLEKEYYLLSKIKNALAYPIIIVIATIITTVVMLVTIIPKLTKIIEESGQQLPILTRIIISTSNFLAHYGLVVLILLIFIGIIAEQYISKGNGKKQWDELKLRLPIFGDIFKKVYLARFAENLSTLIMGGIPILKSLRVVGDVIGNEVYKELMYDIEREVKRGGNMSVVLEISPFVPLMLSKMVAVGEKTGKLDKILTNLAKFYGQQVEDVTSKLTTIIEPILIGFLGIFVGLLAASVLIPIYNFAATGI